MCSLKYKLNIVILDDYINLKTKKARRQEHQKKKTERSLECSVLLAGWRFAAGLHCLFCSYLSTSSWIGSFDCSIWDVMKTGKFTLKNCLNP